MTKSLFAVFYTLLIIFAAILGTMFIPLLREYMHFLFLPLILVFFLLGLVLVFLAVRSKVKKKPKKFLILAGGSAAGFVVCVVLHNFFYAMASLSASIPLLSSLMNMLEVAFFLIALIICPLGFLIGAIGSIVLIVKKNSSKV